MCGYMTTNTHQVRLSDFAGQSMHAITLLLLLLLLLAVDGGWVADGGCCATDNDRPDPTPSAAGLISSMYAYDVSA